MVLKFSRLGIVYVIPAAPSEQLVACDGRYRVDAENAGTENAVLENAVPNVTNMHR